VEAQGEKNQSMEKSVRREMTLLRGIVSPSCSGLGTLRERLYRARAPITGYRAQSCISGGSHDDATIEQTAYRIQVPYTEALCLSCVP
jgi:hypothetical protein